MLPLVCTHENPEHDLAGATFAGVISESRCRVNVLIQCIQAGSARIAQVDNHGERVPDRASSTLRAAQVVIRPMPPNSHWSRPLESRL